MKTRRTAVHARRGPEGSRPAAPGYRLRRERLGEWAAVAALLLLAGLWLSWPAGLYRPRVPPRLPEPAAAYVVAEISGNPLIHRPDGLAHRGPDGGREYQAFSLLPAAAPPPPPPPPPYAAMEAVPPAPPPRTLIREPPPPLAEEPPPDPLPSATSPRARIVRLSPGLRAARFRFTEPRDATGGTGHVRFQILLGPDGRVAALLDEEPGPAEGGRLAWRRALMLGTGATNASGSVEAEW